MGVDFDEKTLKNIVQFLYSHLPSGEGVMAGKRVEIFSGKKENRK
jgi:hypothetical protein